MTLKLHRQFAHPTAAKLKELMKNASAWKPEFEFMLVNISEKCEICKLHIRTPSKPVVALPIASTFNEKVCMDLKKWGNKWILHMIDMWSRFSVSFFVDRKRPSDIINKIMASWVGAGFGMMKSVLTDNGGEFSFDEMREVCSILDVQTLTTAAFSPFQNGLCEHNHAIVDKMLKKMIDFCQGTPTEVLLAWANMAKNSLQMWHGALGTLLLGTLPLGTLPRWENCHWEHCHWEHCPCGNIPTGNIAQVGILPRFFLWGGGGGIIFNIGFSLC